MKRLVWVLALAACSGPAMQMTTPPPVVTGITPGSGNWGTEIAIDGEEFGITMGTSTVSFAGAGAAGFQIDTWNATEIRGRVAFPATGAIIVETAGGQSMAATFTTNEPWVPSPAFDVTKLDRAIVLSTGAVAGMYQEYELANTPALAVFAGSAEGAYPIDELANTADTTAPVIARVVEGDDHNPVVVATKPDNTVVELTLQGGALVSAPTGLTGNVIAAARDATGLYAWIDTASGLVRARPGTPWTTDRGPIATADPALDGAIATDGTLWIVVSEPAASSMAYVSLQMLAPAASTFTALERADPTSYPGAITDAQLVAASDGVHVVVNATATAGTTFMVVPARQRTAAATWSDAPMLPGHVAFAYLGTTLGAVINTSAEDSTSFVPDVTMPAGAEVIPVWPMQSEGIAVDAAGAPHPLLTSGSIAYALTPPAM